MSINKYQQKGLSGMSILFLLVILGFIVVVFLKIFPFYMDNMGISDVLEGIKEQPENANKNVNELRQLVIMRMQEKNLDHLVNRENIKEVVNIEREADGFVMTVKYDRSASLMGNVSLLVNFENQIEVP